MISPLLTSLSSFPPVHPRTSMPCFSLPLEDRDKQKKQISQNNDNKCNKEKAQDTHKQSQTQTVWNPKYT